VLRATSNIRSLFPLLLNTTPKHHMSATSKRNVCNVEKQYLQHPTTHVCKHRDSASATSKINVCNIKNTLKRVATSATFENK
jgi:hypothetical protein